MSLFRIPDYARQINEALAANAAKPRPKSLFNRVLSGISEAASDGSFAEAQAYLNGDYEDRGNEGMSSNYRGGDYWAPAQASHIPQMLGEEIVEQTGGIKDHVAAYIAGLQSDGRLGPEQRQELLREIRFPASAETDAYNQIRADYAKGTGQLGRGQDSVVPGHAGALFETAEASFLRGPIHKSDRSQGAAPTKPATPEEMDAAIKAMIDLRKPASEILNYVASVNGKLDKADLNILRAYDSALQNGQSVQMGVRSLPAESTGLGIVKGAFHPLDRAAEGVENGINFLFGTNFKSAADANRKRTDFFRQNPTTEGGETIGSLATLGLGTARLGPIAGGAISTVLGGNSRSAGDIATDAVFGGIAGKVVDSTLKGAAGLIDPRLAGEVRRLDQQGVTMTPGQVLGGRLKDFEDRAGSLPLVGPKIEAARNKSLEKFNEAAFRRILASAKIPYKNGVPAGHEGVALVESALRIGYSAVLGRMSVTLDDTFSNRMTAILKRNKLPSKYTQEIIDIFYRDVGEAFPRGGRRLSGLDYKKIDERLGDLSDSFMKSGDRYSQQLAKTVFLMKEQLRAAVRRQNPNELAERLRSLDKGWAQYVRVRMAAAKSGDDGIFSPRDLLDATKQHDASVGRGATARGQAIMQDIGADGARVLPNGISNSGTADRLNRASMPEWLVGTLTNPLYSPGAQRGFQGFMLAPRKPAAKAVANTLRKLPGGPVGGIGAGMLLTPPGQ
jgi:hypothetical protein